MSNNSSDNKPTERLKHLLTVLGALSLLLWPPLDSYGQQRCGEVQTQFLNLTRGKSRVINLRQDVNRVSIGNPEVSNIPSLEGKAPTAAASPVDMLVLNRRQILLVGKNLGTTNVIVWDDATNCVVAAYDVEVTHDLQNLQNKLHTILPQEKFQVYSSQDALVLGGEISSSNKMDAALKVAQSFAGEKKPVVNMMQMGGVQQIMLEIKVAEISRSVLRRMGVNMFLFNPNSNSGFGIVGGGGATFPNAPFAQGVPGAIIQSPGGSGNNIPLIGPNSGGDMYNPVVGPLVNLFQPSTPTISNTGLFLYSLSKNLLFSTVLDMLKNNGEAKILAEPTLTTLSGQEAQFRSGGEFPIPVQQAYGGISVDYKPFGVGVNFAPVILDSNRINLKVNINVSDLATTQTANISVPGTNAVFVIPALTLRSATSTIEVKDGQTIAIAGLINDKMREQVQKFPWLGDLPILGLLFRSQEFQKEQTELVMFVTPHLAQPVPPQQVRLPTEAFVEPSDVEFYLLGRMEGQRGGFRLLDPNNQGGGLEGEFGHGL